MNAIWKYLQYGYLIIGIIFFIEGILKWNSDRQESFIMFGFALFITLIFFFKRNFRRRVEKRTNKN